MNKRVKMVQTSRYGWQLRSPKGNIMVDDLTFTGVRQAEDWTIAYVSSHSDWSYELKPRSNNGKVD